jgi:hypothetical protein
MTSASTERKFVALDALYSNFARVAESMGGKAYRDITLVGFPATVVTESRAESVPYLRVLMPGGFVAVLTPTTPLGFAHALTVKVARTHKDGYKADWQFTFGPYGWRGGGRKGPFTDHEIRACLTPEGPPAPVVSN